MAMQKCGPCSLKTGCYLVALYTFILAIILASFNGHDIVYDRNYMFPERVVGLIFAACLFFAGVCLFMGLKNGSHSLVAVWFVIFSIYVIVQIAAIIWYIVSYTSPNYGVLPANMHNSMLANIIVFSVLILVNLLCLYAVRSHRGGGTMNIVV